MKLVVPEAVERQLLVLSVLLGGEKIAMKYFRSWM
jgi:hypothetical protein